MFSSRSKKLFLKISLVPSVTIFFLLFFPISQAQAEGRSWDDSTPATASGKENCKCGYVGEAKEESIHLFVPIPGVTDACGYLCDVDGNGQANLLDYVVTMYKFLVGIACLVAVFMIIWGGYGWIFAMGNASKISEAKETIYSALVGLVLAVVSVQLLKTINPQLTNVTFPDIETIGRVSNRSDFCKSEDIFSYSEAQFNTPLLLDFLSASKEGVRLQADHIIKEENLKIGTDNHAFMQCDGVAQSYKIDGDNPPGPEMVIARALYSQPSAQDIIGEVSANDRLIFGIECFYGLCDPEYSSPEAAIENKGTLISFVKKTFNGKLNQDGGKFIVAAKIGPGDVIATESTEAGIGGACWGNQCSVISPSLNTNAGGVQDTLIDPWTDSQEARICARRQGYINACTPLRGICESLPKGACDQFDQIMVQSLGSKALSFGCGLRDAPFGWAVEGSIRPDDMVGSALSMFSDNTDKCYLGTKFSCPVGWKLDTAFMGNPAAENVCWRYKDKNKGTTELKKCVSPEGHVAVAPILNGQYALEQVTGVCCQPPTGHEKYQCFTTFDYSDKMFGPLAMGTPFFFNKSTYVRWDKVWDDQSPYRECKGQVAGKDCIVYAYNPANTKKYGNGKCQNITCNGNNCLGGNDKALCVSSDYPVKVCYRGSVDGIVFASSQECEDSNTVSLVDAAKNLKRDCYPYVVHKEYPCYQGVIAGGGLGSAAGSSEEQAERDVADQQTSASSVSQAAKNMDTAIVGDIESNVNQSFAVGQTIGRYPVPLDACMFTQAIIAAESSGNKNATHKNDNGTCDCGLMQVNIGVVAGDDCGPACTASGFMPPAANIIEGTGRLIEFFSGCGDSLATSCNKAKTAGEFVPYALQNYRGGKGATKISKDCGPATKGGNDKACTDYGDTCFYNKNAGTDYYATKAECPIDAAGYAGVPSYVKAIQTVYWELSTLNNSNSTRVANCP